ncbi:Sec-independent protein translocase subunit TatA [Streptomyces sulphureus]|uniref:Sec-independent protein translocase subunit TatA n=1 Tax=Streptomyces sulphureus TaxID=47758 RepID=UPI000367E1FB|nr:Sec-independent protein translocase subunit TatA [Streptomyces sulphureus]
MFLRNGLEPWHLLIMAVVVILLMGSKKLPDTARALGKSLRIFRSETRAMQQESGEPGSYGPPSATGPAAAPTGQPDADAASAPPAHAGES